MQRHQPYRFCLDMPTAHVEQGRETGHRDDYWAGFGPCLLKDVCYCEWVRAWLANELVPWADILSNSSQAASHSDTPHQVSTSRKVKPNILFLFSRVHIHNCDTVFLAKPKIWAASRISIYLLLNRLITRSLNWLIVKFLRFLILTATFNWPFTNI